ncbi:hypothetical protein ACQEVZ_22090 [Dactylosporangium sp. CA-152071]|uniref:hypothetical protein n=1 Tax=Dactylosporangium sp. CA-152071 TaxID=3239933 RepID=UPI003D90DD5D
MSFDLAVWYQVGPLTGDEAFAIYERLADGIVGVVEPSPAIAAFLEDLLEVFPDDDDDSAPWAAGIYSTDACVLLAISWSRAEEVARVVERLAAKNALTVYDPQSHLVKGQAG